MKFHDTDIERLLLQSSSNLLKGPLTPLRVALLEKFGPMEKAFIVDWIPEQGEDIYTIVINRDAIIVLEISRHEPTALEFEIKTVRAYFAENPRIGKDTRRKIEAAVRLFAK